MMKIARIKKSNRETYGLIRDGKIATKDDITDATAVPIPINVRDFLFDGWLEEIKTSFEKIPFEQDMSEFELLAPIPNPQKIMCLAFNYLNHAKEQNLTPPNDPVIVMKPRTALCGNTADVICPNFVKELDYEIELAVILGKECKNISEATGISAIVAAIPPMRRILYMLLPIIFPTPISICPFLIAITDVTNSGSEVPIAIITIPITN